MVSDQRAINNAAIAIRDAIISNPFSKRTPSNFAAAFNVSRKKLSPAFKALTGVTIKRFQLEILMHTAGKMLLTGMTVKEVAIECGYMDYQNNFTRVFTNVYGKGPQEWLQTQTPEKKTSS
ncbi:MULTISPECIES: helix-turn-helix domain-containing protein [Niastella]|uniref:AraC family transcriptional regulator n=1 Tax=Niastella soli TaxID=2821487 RepID=A0ABS3YY21_9BACT|nr:helix-turn-helix domain-containing protein [Niastella soli]MBO9202822.1 AraC family transcriptional regulator [Niastella soli]